MRAAAVDAGFRTVARESASGREVELATSGAEHCVVVVDHGGSRRWVIGGVHLVPVPTGASVRRVSIPTTGLSITTDAGPSSGWLVELPGNVRVDDRVISHRPLPEASSFRWGEASGS